MKTFTISIITMMQLSPTPDLLAMVEHNQQWTSYRTVEPIPETRLDETIELLQSNYPIAYLAVNRNTNT